MAYMNQEKKAKIAQTLKQVLAGYDLKYTLKVLHHSKIILTIREGEIDWSKFYNGEQDDRGYWQVNHYWIDKNWNGLAKELLSKMNDAMRSADWFDKSDAMTDYFHTAYYYDIHIGEWCKPYKLKALS